MKTNPTKKVKLKDILILWKQVHQGKWKWKIFLFCEKNLTWKVKVKDILILWKQVQQRKWKWMIFFMFNFSKGLGAPIGSLVLGRYLPWSSSVHWITKRKKVVLTNNYHPPYDHGLLAEIRKPKNSCFKQTSSPSPLFCTAKRWFGKHGVWEKHSVEGCDKQVLYYVFSMYLYLYVVLLNIANE